MKLGHYAIRKALAGSWYAYRDDALIDGSDLTINPNSVDVTLGNILLRPELNGHSWVVDVRKKNTLVYSKFEIPETGHVIWPGQFYLGHVAERFDCAGQFAGKQFAQQLNGRSTLGRLGLCIHATAAYGDYGFSGAFTLEIFNVSQYPIVIYGGIRIGQVSFEEVVDPRVYSGAYVGLDHNIGPVPPVLGPGRF